MSMQVTLLLGSNLGECMEYLTRAVELLKRNVGDVVRATTIHTSSAWGYESDCIYFNQIIVCQTSLTPREVLEACENIEIELGRTKDKNSDWRDLNRTYQDRIMDIDILYYADNKGNNIEYEDDRLQIPHARIEERYFVTVLLKELAELA